MTTTQVGSTTPTPAAAPAPSAPASAQAQAQVQAQAQNGAGQAAFVPKTLGNTDVNGAAVNVSDLKVFGDGDTFKLICKASSQKEGWMKSTKACEVMGIGCMVQVTTQQRNPDGSYAVAEALSFFPGVRVEEEMDAATKKITSRRLVQY